MDELPALMEANPDTAVLVEHVKDCKFPFFANGYGVRPMQRRPVGEHATAAHRLHRY